MELFLQFIRLRQRHSQCCPRHAGESLAYGLGDRHDCIGYVRPRILLYKAEIFRRPLNQRFLQIPERIATAYMDEFRAIRVQEKWQHIFFKKNDALTNVERLHFLPIQSRYEGHVITAEQRRRILRAFVTGWEDRFGFYLDNGFVYLYRSHYLLGRFKIIPCGEDSFRIVNVSYTQEFPSGLNFDESLKCAMHSADSECLQSFRYYRFSWGNPTDSVNPYPNPTIYFKIPNNRG